MKILALVPDIEIGHEYVIFDKEVIEACEPGTITVIGEVSDIVAAAIEDMLREISSYRVSVHTIGNRLDEILNTLERKGW